MIRSLYNEEWVDVVFDEDISEKEKYKISNHGRIMNCKNYRGRPDYILKQRMLNGYPIIQVYKKNGKRTARCVHKLVAQHFLEQKEDDIAVIHLDYDKLNNKAENLKWATKKEKEKHQFSNPEFKNRKQKNNKNHYKLTENKVRLIKRKLSDPNRKTRIKMIAKQFGVSEMQLYRIRSGENWGEVKI